MQKKSFDIPGFLFTLIAGTLLHFVWDWSGRQELIGFFAPVNESVWEHTKLLVYPVLIWFLFRFLTKHEHTFTALPSMALGILAGVAAMIILYYTYTGIWGDNYLPIDILIFILSILTAFIVKEKTAGLGIYPMPTVILSVVVLALLVFCLIRFTSYPPDLNLFQPPE
jgi:hypothetical protein